MLRIPRPSHSKKEPGAELEFKAQLSTRLEALALPVGTSVKVWMMDEARFGLHTELRRVWTLRGLLNCFACPGGLVSQMAHSANTLTILFNVTLLYSAAAEWNLLHDRCATS